MSGVRAPALSSLGEWIRSTGTLVMGTAAAQVISLAASPVLSRFFGPEAFGSYSVFVALMTLLATVSGGRLELAVSLPLHDSQANTIAAAARQLSLVVMLAAAAVGAVLLATLRLLSPSHSSPAWLLLVAPAGLLVAWNGAYAQENLRELNFSLQARLRILRSVAYAAVAIGLAKFSSGSSGLIAATITAQLLVLVAHLRRNPTLIAGRLRTAAMVRRYQEFPTKQVPASLLESGGAYLPLLFFAPAFGPAEAGYFFLAQTVLRQPVQLVSSAASEVFRQWLSQRYAAGESTREGAVRVAVALFALALLVFSPLIIASDVMIPKIFGSEWNDSVIYFQLLAVISAFQFVAGPFSATFYVMSRLSWNLALQACATASVFLLLATAVLAGLSASVTMVLFTLIYVARYSIQMTLSLYLAMHPKLAAWPLHH